jgi:hypothetical protein
VNLSPLRAALGALLLLLAPPQDRSASADPNRETFLTTGFEIGERGAVTLRYRTIAWSPDSWRALRREPEQREQMNCRFGVALQSELQTPIALSVGGRRLEPGSWRLGVLMNEAGAFDLTILVDGETKPVPMDLSESRHVFPYLAFTLVPAQDGLCALVFQWGTEYGRVVLEAAR